MEGNGKLLCADGAIIEGKFSKGKVSGTAHI
jgi:hypothetical protein